MTAKRTTKKKQRLINWSLVPSGPASAATMSVAGLLSGGEIAHLAHVDPVVGAMGAVGGALGQVAIAAGKDAPPAALIYRLACWGTGGGWLWWTLAQGLSVNGAATLAAGAAVAGVCAPLGKIPPRSKARQAAGNALVVRRGGERGLAWERRLARVCNIKGAVVTDIINWPTGAGYDVHVDLPQGGATRKQLLSYAEGLASDARLPEGCGVRIAAGPHRGAVILQVATVNKLAEIIDYPADYSPRSVLDPIVFGELADSQSAGALLRELAVLIAGIRGSGKTTLLQVITAALLRCTDCLVWHLDLNGGGITQPWIDVWLDGRVARCPIDWAAAGTAEAKLALRAAIAIAKHRKASYRQLKREADQSLLPISATLPEIVVIVDEGAEAVKDRELAELIGELQNIGRNEATNLALCALRPTSDLVPVNMRKQSGVRIQMHGPDAEELSHMFGWNRGISLEDLAGKGTAFISVEGATPVPFRVYNLRPRQIEQIATAVAAHRPELDEASAAAAGYDYATRYDRMRAAFGGDTVDSYTSDAGTTTTTTMATHQHGPFTVYNGGGSSGNAADWVIPGTTAAEVRVPSAANAADWVIPAASAATATAQRPRVIPGHAIPTSGPVPAGKSTAQVADAGRPVPELLLRIADIFTQHPGEPRLHTGIILAGLGDVHLSAKRLSGLLGSLGVAPGDEAFFLNDKTLSDKKLRGYARADIQRAIERVRTGQIIPPNDITAWPNAS